MEMTRRTFFAKVIETTAAIIAGSWLVVKKASPRRFITAYKSSRYPGRLKNLSNIEKMSKWSG
jgi:hypothetical protein